MAGFRHSVRKAALAAVLSLMVLVFCWVPSADGQTEPEWTPARVATPKRQSIREPTVAVGPRGYTVIAWAVIPGRYWEGKPPGRGRVRVKLPGARRFIKARAFGRNEVSGVQVGIGRGGQTVLTWDEADGHQRVMYRNTRRGWTKPQVIGGSAMAGGKLLSVGPDGTAVIAGVTPIPNSRGKPMVVAAMRRPGKPFRRFFRISGNPDNFGGDLAAVAGTNGTATVVWQGPCPLGSAESRKPARWVDLAGFRQTRPTVIPGSHCTPWSLNLERDDRGIQYLRLGGSGYLWGGVRLSVRQPGDGFLPPEFVSEFGELTGKQLMSVSPNGFMTMSWFIYRNWRDPGGSYLPTDLETVTFFRGSPVTPVESVANLRFPDFSLADMATLRDGSASMFWLDVMTWKLGTGIVTSGQVFPGPDFFGPPLMYESTTQMGIEAARDDRQFSWWTESGYDGRITDLRWSETR